jgi:hypothetical protein
MTVGASDPSHESWERGGGPIGWPVRYATAALAFATTVVPAAGLVLFAVILNAYGCDESCGGSGWTQDRFSWVWHAQLWLLALPALVAALAVVWFLAAGRPAAALNAYVAQLVFVLAWVLVPLTGGGHLFFGTNQDHAPGWLCYAGLIAIVLGGSLAVAVERAEVLEE